MDVSDDIPNEWIEEDNEIISSINMNDVVGEQDILFICLDTLRWDVAEEEEKNGTTPVLNQYGKWQKCHAPGNFTYPSHHAMFAGFFPTAAEPISFIKRERLFFPKDIGLGKFAPKNSFAFEGSTFVEGLANADYETICIGGVAFFDKRSDIGRVFPNMFKQSYWKPSFGCTVKESTANQIDFAIKTLNKVQNKRVFMYINIDAIHYPNYFYVEGEKKDSVKTHSAALRYVDTQLSKLFEAFKARSKTFVIVCSDHGTCYGEDGYVFHGISHEVVYTVPYKHFELS